jgi:hypothetical protein
MTYFQNVKIIMAYFHLTLITDGKPTESYVEEGRGESWCFARHQLKRPHRSQLVGLNSANL